MNEVLDITVKHKVIAVTGGYGYLGQAICESLSYYGAEVIVLGRSDRKYREAFLEDISGGNIDFFQADISDPNSLRQAFGWIIEQKGRIDCLINNAFYLKGTSPDQMDDTDFAIGLEGTLASVYTCIREVLPFLSKGASIINVSSMYGMVAPDFEVYKNSPSFINPPHYGAAKDGVIQLTKYFSSCLGPKQIRVNCVSPGPFPSAVVQQYKDFVKALDEKTILGRVGQPNELAGIFVFLASNAARYITGQNFVVDGGWTVR